MNKNSTNQVENLLFPELYALTPSFGKNIEVSFTAPDLSSEGGLLLLREFEERIGFIGRLNSCIEDKRVPYLVQHSAGICSMRISRACSSGRRYSASR